MAARQIETRANAPQWLVPSLEVIEGFDFSLLRAEAKKHAVKFWGIDRGNGLTVIPDDLNNRLFRMQKALLKTPAKLKTRDINDWAYNKKSGDFVDAGARALARKITLQKPSKKPKTDKITATAAEAFTIPDVRSGVLGSLALSGDPVMQTIIAFEHERTAQDFVVEDRFLELGYTAFELFLFAIHKDTVIPMIGELALGKELPE